MAGQPCPDRAELEACAASPGGGAAAAAAHARVCTRCAEILEEIRADNALLAEAAAARAGCAGPEAPGSALPVIEGYEVHGEVHRGAQGVVFRATQVATRRPVAIKVMARGAFATTRQRHRFEREVELVAALRHPNVVTVYESGRTADGSHYLAMELIEGESLEEHLRRLGPPEDRREIRRRLRLHASVCTAVAAAHQRGIIHRDLKPANVMVDATGAPHVLDFGLARRDAADGPAATIAGEFLGTFAYAAPEQVKGDPAAVDVRCDVYALGVILYEMLTGQRPYALAGSMGDVIEAILHAPPRRPAPGLIDRDVETILLKALDKDPDRRYQSAGLLQEDIERALARRPIAARADSQWYVLRKTLARHKLPVSAGAAAVCLLATFVVTLAVQVRRADRAGRSATDYLNSLLGVLGSEKLQGRLEDQALPALFAEADALVTAHLAEQPAAAAAVRQQLGLAQMERGYYEEALRQFEAALALRLELGERDTAELAEAHHNLARALWFRSRYEEAERHYIEALRLRRAIFGTPHESVALTLHHLAATERKLGFVEEAEARYREALEMRRRLGSREDMAATLNSLGVLYEEQGHFERSLPVYAEALEIVSQLPGGATDPRAATASQNVAWCLVAMNRLDDAQVEIDRTLAIKRASYDDDHPSIALTQRLQAELWFKRGELDRALDLARAVLPVLETAHGPSHPLVGDALDLLGRILLRRGQPGAAEPFLRRALEIRAERLPPGHWRLKETRSAMEECMGAMGEE
jgi:serine/threonine-protein kinase